MNKLNIKNACMEIEGCIRMNCVNNSVNNVDEVGL